MKPCRNRLIPVVIILILAVASISACSFDIFGFFSSESAPDERFDESRKMAQPLDQNFSDAFSFIFVTDLHIRNGTHDYFRGLKSRLDGASFVLVGGDLSDAGDKKDIDEFIAASAFLGVPVYAVPGNHDLYNGGWSRTKAIGPSSFTVKLGQNTRLVCLDSANGTLGTKQAEWLDALLSRASESTIIVATHMNFFSSDGIGALEFTSVEETAMLLSMFQDAGVDLDLAGHEHRYEAEKIGTMHYCVGDAFVDGDSSTSYVMVTCSGGSISFARRYY